MKKTTQLLALIILSSSMLLSAIPERTEILLTGGLTTGLGAIMLYHTVKNTNQLHDHYVETKNNNNALAQKLNKKRYLLSYMSIFTAGSTIAWGCAPLCRGITSTTPNYNTLKKLHTGISAILTANFLAYSYLNVSEASTYLSILRNKPTAVKNPTAWRMHCAEKLATAAAWSMVATPYLAATHYFYNQ